MRLHSVFRELGAWDGVLYALTRVLERVSHGHCRIVKYRLVAQPIGAPDTATLRPDAATVIETAGPESDLLSAFPRPPEVVARRYAAGAVCIAARVRGDFAGFIWLQRGHYREDEVRCTYVLAAPAQSVWDFDVYVEPRFRIGRTLARLWRHVDAEQAAMGVRWSFSRISAFNPASLAAHSRLGLVRCGSALFLRLGPLQLSWVPQFPFLHISVSDDQAPSVRLRPPG